jgi:hypothetical protein
MVTKELATRIIERYLLQAFDDGNKAQRNTAERSEYFSPHYEYDVAPKLLAELKSDFASVATTDNVPSLPRQLESLVIPPDGFRLLTNFETMQNGDKYYKDGKWNDIFTTSWDDPYCDEIYRPVMRAV